MTKEYLSLIVVLLALSVLIAGCGTDNELSAPSPTATDLPAPSPTSTDLPEPSPTAIDLALLSTRLVGHWARFQEGKSEAFLDVYFEDADEKGSGKGFWREWDESWHFNYLILSGNGDTLLLTVAEEGDSAPSWNFEVKLAKDGQSMIYDEREFQYIDSKTEP